MVLYDVTGDWLYASDFGHVMHQQHAVGAHTLSRNQQHVIMLLQLFSHKMTHTYGQLWLPCHDTQNMPQITPVAAAV